MEFCVVDNAKSIWKKLKDHHRYYTSKSQGKSKSGEAAPEEPDDSNLDFEMREELSFLSQYAPQSLRTTMSLGGDSEIDSFDQSLDHSLDDTNLSNYSYTTGPSKGTKKENRALEAAAMVGESISKYFDQKTSSQTKEPAMKHGHIWQQLEKLFEELPSADIVDLNFLFISETYKKIQSNRNK